MTKETYKQTTTKHTKQLKQKGQQQENNIKNTQKKHTNKIII